MPVAQETSLLAPEADPKAFVATGAAITAFVASVPSCGPVRSLVGADKPPVDVPSGASGDAGANLIMWVLHGGAALCLLACLVFVGLGVLAIMNGRPTARLFVMALAALFVALVAEAIALLWGVVLWATVGLFIALAVAGIGGVIWYAYDIRDGRVDAHLLRKILRLDRKENTDGI